MGKWDDAVHNSCVNSIRFLSVDAINKANSGHPGLPMGAAPMAYVLWQGHLKHNPADPNWPDRDRFVLSAGHGSMLLYSLLHLSGYDVTLEDIKNFRQWESKTPGHPESFMTPGVECTTGPLGQGIGNAVGMAIAERHMAAYFNKPDFPIVDHHTYCLCGDGDVMEGVAQEAVSLAAHLKLGKLICLYDSNDVTLDGPAGMSFSEDVAKRYKAYGWQVIRVEGADTDLNAIHRAISKAKKDATKPTLIEVRTTIGYGAPSVAGTCKAHGSPLGEEETVAAKKALGWDAPPFTVPLDALGEFEKAGKKGKRVQSKWQKLFDAYSAQNQELATEFDQWVAGVLPKDWDSDMPVWEAGDKAATRAASGKVINSFAGKAKNFMGGDADLSGSTKTLIDDGGDFDGQDGSGRNIHYGVREHAMAAIANGMAYHGGIRPFVATFFVFSDYMRPSVRLAAMSQLPVIYVWTHDSVGVGEDGPTHQPVEQMMALRSMPNVSVIRPCDPNETAEAWRLAVSISDGPSALILSRQNLAALDRTVCAPASGLQKGAYVLKDCDGTPDCILIGTGSEVHPALEAQDKLTSQGVKVRVVSMPCWEAFEKQDRDYQDSVLPPDVKVRISIEAGVTFGWQRWTGDRGRTIGLDTFGASAPGDMIMEKLGFSSQNIVKVAKEALGR